MQVERFSEVRTTNGVRFTPDSHFFFSGFGHPRHDKNDGQPDILNARSGGRGRTIDGRVMGTVKMVHIAGALGWFSLRSVGPKGNGVTVYVQGSALAVLDGKETTVAALYADLNTQG